MAQVIFVRYPDCQDPDDDADGTVTPIGQGQMAELACAIRDTVNAGDLVDVAIVSEVRAMHALAMLQREIRKHTDVLKVEVAQCTPCYCSHRSTSVQALDLQVGYIHAVSHMRKHVIVLTDADGCEKLPTLFASLHGFEIEERYIGMGQAIVVYADHHAHWVIG